MVSPVSVPPDARSSVPSKMLSTSPNLEGQTIQILPKSENGSEAVSSRPWTQLVKDVQDAVATRGIAALPENAITDLRSVRDQVVKSIGTKFEGSRLRTLPVIGWFIRTIVIPFSQSRVQRQFKKMKSIIRGKIQTPGATSDSIFAQAMQLGDTGLMTTTWRENKENGDIGQNALTSAIRDNKLDQIKAYLQAMKIVFPDRAVTSQFKQVLIEAAKGEHGDVLELIFRHLEGKAEFESIVKEVFSDLLRGSNALSGESVVAMGTMLNGLKAVEGGKEIIKAVFNQSGEVNPLYVAAENGHAAVIEAMLNGLKAVEGGKEVIKAVFNQSGEVNPLYVAVENTSSAAIKVILDGLKDVEGGEALIKALFSQLCVKFFNGHYDAMQAMFDWIKEASLQQIIRGVFRPNFADNPLYLAVKGGDVTAEAITSMLDALKKADYKKEVIEPIFSQEGTYNPLYAAAASVNFSYVHAILREMSEDEIVTVLSREVDNPLSAVVKAELGKKIRVVDQVDLLKVMLKRLQEVSEEKMNAVLSNILYLAVQRGNSEVVDTILKSMTDKQFTVVCTDDLLKFVEKNNLLMISKLLTARQGRCQPSRPSNLLGQ